MSNDVSSVRGLQVDPGNIDWAMATVYDGSVAMAQVLAANVAHGAYQAQTEHWFACRGAEAALAQATKLKLQHHGEYDWNDFRVKWVNGAATGRSTDYVTMGTDVAYAAVNTGPSRVFEGTVVLASGASVALRLALSFANGKLAHIEWFHKGPAQPGYLLQLDAVLDLDEKTSPAWGTGWRRFGWP